MNADDRRDLIHLFGRKSRTARAVVPLLCNGLLESFASNSSGPAARLFERWRSQFGLQYVVAERRGDLRRARIDAWRRKWLADAPECDADVFLFAVQTYCAAVVKLSATRILTGEAPEDDSSNDDVDFWASVESGAWFRKRWVVNMVLGDEYQAALATRRDSCLTGLATLRAASLRLSKPAPPDLGALYLDLFPREVRHALGEYDTPPELASHVLDCVGLQPNDARTVLDPMCGCGAFLHQVIRRRAGGRAGTSLDGIVGIDLHPLAVLATKATLLSHLQRIDQRVPTTLLVFRGDAILAAWRRRAKASTGVDDPNKTSMENPTGIISETGARDFLCDADGLASESLTLARLNRFDLVVGNPPWVGWESLRSEYREGLAPLWCEYGLFAQTGMESILGGGKKDLSMLAAYAAADGFLKPGGLLSFVLSESTFKSVEAARGFRRFQIGGDSDGAMQVVRVDDLTRIDPFANAATRSMVLTLKKGEPTTYPVPVVQWTPSMHRSASAEPIDPADDQSPWLTAPSEALPLIRRMLGASRLRGYEGVNTGGANGVFWLRVLEKSSGDAILVENLPECGRTKTNLVRAEIEERFVYPLLRHQDVKRWSARPEFAILLLQDPDRRRGVDAALLRAEAPKTFEYIQGFEAQLRRRAAFRRFFEKQASAASAFYSMFNVGPYTLAPIKVVWRRMTAPIEAAVVASEGAKPPLPQETLCLAPCATAEEARFYAGLFNSSAFNAAALATSQGSTKSFGAPHLVKHVRLPTYDPTREAHRSFATAAAEVARAGDSDNESLDLEAAGVFGLSGRDAAILKDELSFQLGESR